MFTRLGLEPPGPKATVTVSQRPRGPGLPRSPSPSDTQARAGLAAAPSGGRSLFAWLDLEMGLVWGKPVFGAQSSPRLGALMKPTVFPQELKPRLAPGRCQAAQASHTLPSKTASGPPLAAADHCRLVWAPAQPLRRSALAPLFSGAGLTELGGSWGSRFGNSGPAGYVVCVLPSALLKT